MRACLLTVTILFLLARCCAPGWAAGEPLHHFEVWRSPFGYGAGAVINPTDGSVWACMGDSVYHYDTDNTLLSRTELWWPQTPCVDADDGSCWVVEAGQWTLDSCVCSMVHLGADGKVLQEVTGFDGPQISTRCGPDGSVWIAENPSSGWGQLRLVSGEGMTVATLTRVNAESGWFNDPEVNPVDGSCWVDFYYTTGMQEYNLLVHVGVKGDVLGYSAVPWTGVEPRRLNAPNGADGSVWRLDLENKDLVHDSAKGEELLRVPLPNDYTGGLTLDPRDGSCWVSGFDKVTQVGADGSLITSLVCPWGLPDFATGMYWGAQWVNFVGGLADGQERQDPLRRYAADGSELWRTGEHLSREGWAPSSPEIQEPGDFFWDEAGHAVWSWDRNWTLTGTQDLVRVADTGQVAWRGQPLEEDWEQAAFNSADGSLTFLDGTTARALQIAGMARSDTSR